MTSAPGWYEDPQQPLMLRWWDGIAWTQAVQPRPLDERSRRSLGSDWFHLATVLWVTLVALALANVFFLGLDLWGLRLFGAWKDGVAEVDIAAAERFDALTLAGAVVNGLLSVLCLVLFIVWNFRAHRSNRMDDGYLEHRSGWAIAGWFVPIMNLFRPCQMVIDVRRGAVAGLTSDRVVLAWWWALLIGSVLQRIANRAAPTENGTAEDALAALERTLQVEVAASLLLIPAALLAVAVVRSTTRLVASSEPRLNSPSDIW